MSNPPPPSGDNAPSLDTVVHTLSPFDQAAPRFKCLLRSFVFRLSKLPSDEEFATIKCNILERLEADKPGSNQSRRSSSPVLLTSEDYADDFCRIKHRDSYSGLTAAFIQDSGFPPLPSRDANNNYFFPEGKQPAMTLQADFLTGQDTCYLILSFAVLGTLADNASLDLIYKAFGVGLPPGDRPFSCVELNPLNHRLELSLYRPARPSTVNRIPEWKGRRMQRIRPENLSASPVNVIFAISSGSVDDLVYLVNEYLKGKSKLKMDHDICVAAWCWVAITEARVWRLDPRAETCFGISVNCRSKLRPPLPVTFFGNMTLKAFARTTVGTPLPPCCDPARFHRTKSPVEIIAAAALLLREAIDSLNHEYICRRLWALSGATVSAIRNVSRSSNRKTRSNNEGVQFTPLSDFAAEMDFGIPLTAGGGLPIHCRQPAGLQEGVVYLLPRNASDGSNAS
ncbi:Putative chloramphenicol acetyltransferase-like domain superfamily [Colletotrichum destructivum]|uniref:Chloramphenicol acetyltransferase-like domain superfamily n=1 Tax=Colletotrichum destructivum TaxID=34406 RepID=A0AAX4IYR9_9PEZI|nr:Putative chloramphenicol acetyltransferase-like domain superfamily [Colletotrichum destructivum]